MLFLQFVHQQFFGPSHRKNLDKHCGSGDGETCVCSRGTAYDVNNIQLFYFSNSPRSQPSKGLMQLMDLF